MDLPCVVYMGEVDIERQAPNEKNANVARSTSGKSGTLKDATNEAMRDWQTQWTHYIIGSVVGPHPFPDMVARFQSVISGKIKKSTLQKTNSPLPDYVVACVGGGSNAVGAFYHF